MRWCGRSVPLFQLARWSEAETAMTAEIERGGAMGNVFFTRGIVRLQLNRLADAEQDFSDALGGAVNLEALALQIQQLEHGLSGNATSATDDVPGVGDAMIYAMRGWIRLRLGRNAEAEEDLTIAIEKNVARELTSLASAMRASTLPMMANAARKLELPAMVSDGAFYHLRGLTRLNLGKLAEAVADFDRAIAQGFVDGEVYHGRGVAHLRMDQIAEAERDAGLAIVATKEDAATFTLRGAARLGLKRFAEAEEDLGRAITLDPENVQLYSWRAEPASSSGRPRPANRTSRRCSHFSRTTPERSTCAAWCASISDGSLKPKRTSQQRPRAATRIACCSSLKGFARLMQNKLAEAADDAELAIDEGRGDMQAIAARRRRTGAGALRAGRTGPQRGDRPRPQRRMGVRQSRHRAL